ANFVDPFIWTKLLGGLGAHMERHAISRLADVTGTLDTTQKEKAWISS
nr:hypothetical protein [Acidobacteriota bacterium]